MDFDDDGTCVIEDGGFALCSPEWLVVSVAAMVRLSQVPSAGVEECRPSGDLAMVRQLRHVVSNGIT